jgi:hypothetical protein
MSNEERKYAIFRIIYEALAKLSHDHYLDTSEARKAVEKLERS